MIPRHPTTLIIAGEKFNLRQKLLDSFLSSEEIDYLFDSPPWRDYINSTWEIKDGGLYLIDFEGKLNSKKINFKDLYKKETTFPVKAAWFSGKLWFPTGEKVEYFSHGYFASHPEMLTIEIENGNVIQFSYEKHQFESEKLLDDYAVSPVAVINLSEAEIIDFLKGNGIVRMTAFPTIDIESKVNKVSFYATVQKIRIDWGDGAIEEFNPCGNLQEFTHEYNGRGRKWILLFTEGLTALGRKYQEITPLGDAYNYFSFGENDFIEISIGNCPDFKEIYFPSQYAPVKKFDIEKVAPQLEGLYFNSSFSMLLDFDKCTSLKELYYNCNGAETINLDGFAETLTVLECYMNYLHSLDLSKCRNLKKLNCRDNDLTYLNLKSCASTLEELSCGKNPLENIEALEECSRLKELDVSCTLIKELDMSNYYPDLKFLFCSDIFITKLTITDCPRLLYLQCIYNRKLELLIIANCKNMERITAYSCKLSTLEITDCPNLKHIDCEYNKLKSITIDNYSSLKVLDVRMNKLSHFELNKIFENLPQKNGDEEHKIFIRGNPGVSKCDKTIATRKGWKVYV